MADHHKHPAYGTLAGCDRATLWQVMDDLIGTGEIALDAHSRLIYLSAPERQPATP